MNFFKKRVKSLLIPTGTKRERIYNLIINSLPLLREKGLIFLCKKAVRVLRRLRVEQNIMKEHYIIPVIKNEGGKRLNTKISIIIPTKNAGIELQCALEKIHNQKGLGETEIIIMDSGSIDDTLHIARKFTSHIYSIDPSDFNHGTTRNLGAEKASGEFLIFMSQDAVPISDFCIFDIVSKIQQDDGIAAATVKQVPRSDADMFACWQLWIYNKKTLNYAKDSIVSLTDKQVKGLAPFDRRRFMQIDNVFSCFRRATFNKFKFNPLSYAEDLDIGMRLINAGYKILFLKSVGVIHSHTRDPAYFFKRAYIDIKTLLRLLRHDPINWENLGIHSMHQLLSYMYSFYRNVNHSIRKVSTVYSPHSPLDILLLKIKTDLHSGDNGEFSPGDPGMDELFQQIVMKQSHLESKHLGIKHDVLVSQYLTSLDSFAEYLNTSYTRITPENIREFISASYKLLAWTCGSHLGNYAVFSERIEKAEKSSYIENIIGRG